MTGPEFVVVGRHVDLPFRPRRLFVDHWSFGADDFAVLLSPRVRQRLLDAAASADPHETGGVVVGRIFRDTHGTYSLVMDVVCAPPEAGDLGSFRLSPELTTHLKEDAARRLPSCDTIGWWHSHLTPSPYSRTDRENQRIWSDPRHVGILVFARAVDDEWARIYVGPDSRVAQALPPPGSGPGGGADAATEPRAPTEPRAAVEPREPPGSRHRAMERGGSGWISFSTDGHGAGGAAHRLPRPRPEPAVLLGRWLLTTAVVTLVIGVAVLCGYRVLARLVDDTTPADGPPRLSWSCQPVDPGSYLCSAASDRANDLEWWVNGRRAATGATLTVEAPTTQVPTTVELYLRQDGRVVRLGGMALHGWGVGVPASAGQATATRSPPTAKPRWG